MKITTDIQEANKLLQSYAGAVLQIAFYHESLKRMALRIWLPDSDKVIYLVGVGCERISGYFYNTNVKLSITASIDEKTNEQITIIKDQSSGFELSNLGGFSVAQGHLSEFGNSFDDFIKADNT